MRSTASRCLARLLRRLPRVAARACLLLLGAAALLPQAVAHAAAAPRVAVLRFDFYDTSIDHRAALLGRQQQWLRRLPRQFGRALQAAAPGVRIAGGPAWLRQERSMASDYEHPNTCGPCVVRAGRAAHADYVLAGAVRKVSDLILYLQARLVDPRTRTVVAQYLLEVKADNGTMWRRAAQHLARQVAHTLRGRR